jgi:hypothetical protein
LDDCNFGYIKKKKLALEKKEKETKREVLMKSLEEEGLFLFFLNLIFLK